MKMKEFGPTGGGGGGGASLGFATANASLIMIGS